MATDATFTFTEDMTGFVTFGETSFERGYRQGERDGTALMFRLTIGGDVDRLVEEPAHEASATGWVECAALGGRCRVESGVFNLFVETADLDTRKMHYRLFFHDGAGQAVTLSGHKRVQQTPGLSVWQDTTTLFVTLFRGHLTADEEASSPVLAAGILRIRLLDFLRQLTTIRTVGPTMRARAQALERFARYFLGSLWDVYGPACLPRMNEYHREVPTYTLDGVADADVTVHPFSTADRLGLGLLRFRRAPSDDVVVIIHGLTTSSDMFIMPEHVNLVSYLLDHGFSDVWTLDFRMSNRWPYNLRRHRYNMDDVALYDYPPAFARVREAVGPRARIHVICHCLGSVSFMMSLFGRAVDGIASVISNSVALTPKVPRWSGVKLAVGPFLAENILGFEYVNPFWRRQPGWSMGKLFAWTVSLLHRECRVPECHMLSFMWGSGFPALYNHENLLDVTHERGGDLYGGTSMSYYRHVRRMVGANNTAVKRHPGDPRYRVLPDDYFEHAAAIETPVLFVTGDRNRVFADSNIECYERLERIAPGRHELKVFSNYGHQDVFMGRQVHIDIFPRFVEFLEKHRSTRPQAAVPAAPLRVGAGAGR